MQLSFKFFRKYIFLILVLILSIPAFYQMLKPGIFSMQDFPLFRLYEFDKCVRALQIPCRWSPDAGLGYGEPVFNFYGQLVFTLGEVFHLLSFGFIDSLKILFTFSLVGSAVSMYFLAKKLWKDEYAAIISSTIYLYAPYRAVDVWVRGALPEAFGFVLFPLILLSIEEKSLFWFTALTSLLVLTHNLSFVMYLPILVVWVVYRKFWKVAVGSVGAFFISAFYILPVIFESKYITLSATITGYFDYRAHFATLYQLFISRLWGYGASVWGMSDGLSLSIGQIQWLLPTIIMAIMICRYIIIRDKKIFSLNSLSLILFLIGYFYLFLTHNKSTFIWNLIPQMAYIQFPWRFLGVATFSLALAGGVIVNFFNRKYSFWIAFFIVALSLAANYMFFRPDIWYNVDDSYFVTGAEWDRQRSASIGDFWPNFGHEIPHFPSDGRYINYFPGWVGAVPDKNGLIPAKGTYFTDTPVRKAGNYISLVAIIILSGFATRRKWIEKR